ncbi:hypothetical protein A374_15818 [Fictibacillus macauensis ZFHKF-1]|uniref:Uncharacterized protein n=1 Tax=Fictibacillus macauensis ZFHKF-1 TaxID=1196324 RepID=I8UBU6_9BACL|nr:hypothetical protein [Fictibacillus macauensis]EIT84268.1 hypothetical protein A374_15818 [Fictibacillus macauensis ZFHKF-1]
MAPKAYGIFSVRNNECFRDHAYLQWGKSEVSLGSCLILHAPTISEKEAVDRRALSPRQTYETKQIPLDATMRQLAAFLTHLHHNQKLNGRLHIYSVLPLQCVRPGVPAEYFEFIASETSMSSPLPTAEELRRHPWLIVSWGTVHRSSWRRTAAVKNNWLHALKESGILCFGKKIASKGKYALYNHVGAIRGKNQADIMKQLTSYYNEARNGSL